MPIVKGNQALPPRPVIMVLFGEPGATKTSIANTCDTPLLIDADKGASRSHHRGDTLQLDSWEEVLAEESAGSFRNYKTIVIDTAKAVLDDFLTTYVIKKDYKLKVNKLGMYGAIGDEFKVFVNNRRSDKADLIIVCHAKREEDTKRIIPDVTGGSYQLLMRIADQVGYVSIKNGKRVITFEPTETTVGKNVAAIPETVVPAKDSLEFKTFGAQLVERVRTSIAEMSEEQKKALEQSKADQEKISKCATPDELTATINEVNSLPEYLKNPLRKLIGEKAAEMKWAYNVDLKKFEVAKAAPAVEEEPKAAPKPEPDPLPAQPTLIPSTDGSAEAFEKMVKETEAPIQEEIPKGAAKFKKSYSHTTTLEAVLAECKTTQEVAGLYFVNSDIIGKNDWLGNKFMDKKSQLNESKAAA